MDICVRPPKNPDGGKHAGTTGSAAQSSTGSSDPYTTLRAGHAEITPAP